MKIFKSLILSLTLCLAACGKSDNVKIESLGSAKVIYQGRANVDCHESVLYTIETPSGTLYVIENYRGMAMVLVPKK